MRKTFYAVLGLLMLLLANSESAFAFKGREFYQIRIYYYETSEQETRLDQYLQNAFIPALHRLKIKHVGVFKPMANDTSVLKRIVVLIPFKKLEQFHELGSKLAKDQAYQTAGADYINTVFSSPAYKRMELVLLEAFSEMPILSKPQLKSPPGERVYEMRSYESASEKIHENKVHMFNEGGEVKLFERLGFNAVFYGQVIAGGKMPNLMYMTSFENMADRDAHWKSFRDDAEWKKLSAMPQYQKNVSKNETVFMRGTPYSDL